MPDIAPLLRVGAQAPNFTLEASDGTPIRRSAYRARRNLAIILLPDLGPAALAYLAQLRDAYAAIRAEDSEALALMAAVDRAALRAAIDLPFPLLHDPAGAVTRRYLPEQAAYGLFILDRYATIYAQWALATPDLPPVSAVVAWLNAVDCQCSV